MTSPLASTPPPRRARGRPRRLSPDAVLEAALAQFEDEPAAEFTLSRLARRLAVPITSLYTYFPNRDALLDAAADRVFARFDWRAEAGAPWQQVLLSWMHALQRHFEHYPVAQQLLSWDRRISPAWLRVLTPIITLLHAQGLRGRELVQTFSWLNNGTIGLIMSHAYTVQNPPRPALGVADLAGGGDSVEAQREFWSHADTLDAESALEAGFRVLVAGVAAALPASGAATRSQSRSHHGREKP